VRFVGRASRHFDAFHTLAPFVPESAADVVIGWLLGKTTAAQVDRAVFDFAGHPLAPMLAVTRNRLESLRRTYG
jgi:hypothetical protein